MASPPPTVGNHYCNYDIGGSKYKLNQAYEIVLTALYTALAYRSDSRWQLWDHLFTTVIDPLINIFINIVWAKVLVPKLLSENGILKCLYFWCDSASVGGSRGQPSGKQSEEGAEENDAALAKLTVFNSFISNSLC